MRISDQGTPLSTPASRVDYLNDPSDQQAFHKVLVEFVGDVLKERLSQLIPPENVQRFRHGGEWRHPGLPDAYNGGMQQHSTEISIPFEELVRHDLSAIARYVDRITEDMNAQIQRMMFATISAACDQNGNVVDANAAGGPIEGFAAMLEKIRFTTDKHGNVQRPQMHLSPQAFDTFQKAEASAPPELLHRIKELDRLRVAEAIQDEAQRKARFVHYGETTSPGQEETP